MWRSLKVAKSEIDIATVLLGGQSFRWKACESDEKEFYGVFSHKLWILRQNEEEILYQILPDNNDVDSVDSEKLLYDYFQLDISLSKLYSHWAEKDEKFASLTSKEKFQGVRILAQDPMENIFSFICSSNNNIQRISQMVEKLCLTYGPKLTSYKGQSIFDFPPVEKLAGPNVESKLRQMGFGYRAAYISKSARKIVENGGSEWVNGLRHMSYKDGKAQLQTLPGVGPKVADCICLMSLGFSEAVPVDTHIHQVAKTYLPHLGKLKSLTDKAYTEIGDFFRTLYGEYAGWAQAVLFATTLSQFKSKSDENVHVSDKVGKKRSHSQLNHSSSKVNCKRIPSS